MILHVVFVDFISTKSLSKSTQDTYLSKLFNDEYSVHNKFLIFKNCVKDTRVQFDKNYTEFENGFGNRKSGNYWRGLKILHKLTLKAMGVRFELTVSDT